MAVHTHLGDQLLPFAGLLLVLVAAVMLVSHRAGQNSDQRHGHRMDRASEGGTTTATATWVRPVALTLSTLTVAAAAVTVVQVVRIGDSGARAAWGDTQYVQQAPEHGGDDG